MQQAMTKRQWLLQSLFVLLMVSAISIPNSVKLTVSALLAFFFIYSVFVNRKIGIGSEFLGWWIATTLVTLIYMTIGVFKGAPSAAVGQVILIYIVSPLLWVAAWRAAYLRFGVEFVRKSIIFVAALAYITVPIFIVAFQNGQMSIVHFLAGSEEGGNVNIRDGYAGTTMHVYGSMIFILAGFFASPQIIPGKLLRGVMIIAGLMVALTSGRVALIVALVIGLIAGVFMTDKPEKAFKKVLVFSSLSIVFFFLTQHILFEFFGIDVSIMLNQSSDHVVDLGGIDRRLQFLSLISAANDTYFLGAGHGIGTDYQRSVQFPWRYELVWFAVLMKTGIVGACIYAGLFIVALFKGARLVLSRWATPMDRFMMGGYLAALAASGTNPYIEAVMLQWMYVLPVVHFLLRSSDVRVSRPIASPARPAVSSVHLSSA